VTLAPDASTTASSTAASSQLLDAALRAVAAVTGMQVAFASTIDGETLTWKQLHGALDGLTAGSAMALADTFCGRMLASAPSHVGDAGADPHYAGVPLRSQLGVTAYVGMPLRRKGVVVGTFGAMDTSAVDLGSAQLRVVSALARLCVDGDSDPDVRLHRTATGWEVESGDGGRQADIDLTVAMTLADFLAGDAAETVPAQRPQRPAEELGEVESLRLQVRQLEHALTARIVIEQAIGVLAERHALAPREAFDRLRKAARGRGRRVHDLATEVVRSARDDVIVLPSDLG
jgi:hypothetical protein